MSTDYKDYGFKSAGPGHMHGRFLPAVLKLCSACGSGTRVLDVGCGNGYTLGQFLSRGCTVVGVDLSESGIGLARKTLTRLLEETGFENIQFRGAGRLPYLWMTMVLSADKPTPRSTKTPIQ